MSVLKNIFSMHDLFILGPAFFSFLGLIVLFFLFFRFVTKSHILRVLKASLLAGLMGNVILIFTLKETLTMTSIGEGEFIFCLVFSGFIFLMMSFLFVLIVIGPAETSIRIRLLLELYRAGGQSVNFEQLAASYNAKDILMKRLPRLVQSGELKKAGEDYLLGQEHNIFHLLTKCSSVLKRFMARK